MPKVQRVGDKSNEDHWAQAENVCNDRRAGVAAGDDERGSEARQSSGKAREGGFIGVEDGWHQELHKMPVSEAMLQPAAALIVGR